MKIIGTVLLLILLLILVLTMFSITCDVYIDKERQKVTVKYLFFRLWSMDSEKKDEEEEGSEKPPDTEAAGSENRDSGTVVKDSKAEEGTPKKQKEENKSDTTAEEERAEKKDAPSSDTEPQTEISPKVSASSEKKDERAADTKAGSSESLSEKKEDHKQAEDKTKTDKGSEKKEPKEDSTVKKALDFYKEYSDAIHEAVGKVFKALGKTLRAIRFEHFNLEYAAAGKDAFDTSQKYYKLCSAILGGIGFLSTVFTIKVERVKIDPAFEPEKEDYRISFRACIRVCILFALVFALLGAAIVFFIRYKFGHVQKNKNKNIKELEKMQDNKINSLMEVTLDKIKQIADIDTVVGEPIKVEPDITIIPVSKVSYGVGSGGSDLPVKAAGKEYFGGGAGAGMTVAPIGFLVIQNGNVKLMQIHDNYKGGIVDAIPGVVDSISSFFSKGSKSAETAEVVEVVNPSDTAAAADAPKQTTKKKRFFSKK